MHPTAPLQIAERLGSSCTGGATPEGVGGHKLLYEESPSGGIGSARTVFVVDAAAPCAIGKVTSRAALFARLHCSLDYIAGHLIR